MPEPNNNNNSYEKTEQMKRYEKETGRYAIWRGVVTKGFRKWQRGEKVYHRDKERISLYVPEDTKSKWLDYTQIFCITITECLQNNGYLIKKER